MKDNKYYQKNKHKRYSTTRQGSSPLMQITFPHHMRFYMDLLLIFSREWVKWTGQFKVTMRMLEYEE